MEIVQFSPTTEAKTLLIAVGLSKGTCNKTKLGLVTRMILTYSSNTIPPQT